MTIKLMFSAGSNSKEILRFIKEFNSDLGTVGSGDRNVIKLFDLNGQTINIKSFKVPNIVNKVAYKYRKSKAKRSFEYATILLENGIGTPQPLAY
jgi:hypothetical protein